MLISPGAVINTSSFVASTSDVNPDSFMAGGPIEFIKSPLTSADSEIINRKISVSDAGVVALLAPQVKNDGVIDARLGQVQLAAGTQATLDISGDGLLNIVLDSDIAGSITNNGEITAGYVRIGGGDAADFVNSAINLNGLVEATGLEGQRSVDVQTSGDLIVNGNIKALGSSLGDIMEQFLGDRVAL